MVAVARVTKETGESILESTRGSDSNNFRILAHRGLWREKSDQNSLEAIKRAVHLGFGIETDVRDFSGTLVLSHDIPTGGELTFSDFADFIRSHGLPLPFALNVKSDGLAEALSIAMDYEHKAFSNAFYFDMSVPQVLQYRKHGLPIALRNSEYESVDGLAKIFPDQTKKWVWLDSFEGEWWLETSTLGDTRYAHVVVSPELHGRPHAEAWAAVRAAIRSGLDVYICTDFPIEFARYLNDG